ncbi:hypothetical protein LITTLEE_97 [Mycobacterium phage LittleE]|uniref:Uncharacterized protein n=4 Tax=Omegavirus TaxID=1623292 RepID=Q854G4_BPMOM|nr:gp103 [Mycobacterium phage Omega]YP_009011988.1 hypothetical protein CM09_gp089 [Mycobacterium phage Courthouse]YP_009205223.1 hypothetical protein AVT17_gp093 [Mycobacterium phage Ariel]YP_009213311.1 hypothetical protein AVV70_gp094 [Mycobacterium phage MiaZeal]YP_009637008.1 hypothetical protein FGG27_gp097 [Mycobacterium phage LittleE]ASD50722.1 hypothetical protein PORCELAIN_92 [Mycobacterium phage Porcelain]ASD53484.1 hypothetical protein PBI_LUCKY2013_91 [Mycobacterium phage Lucky20
MKTCYRGHERSEANTYIFFDSQTGQKKHMCRECRRKVGRVCGYCNTAFTTTLQHDSWVCPTCTAGGASTTDYAPLGSTWVTSG